MASAKWQILGITVIGAGLAAALPYHRSSNDAGNREAPPVSRPDLRWRGPPGDPAKETTRFENEQAAGSLFVADPEPVESPSPEVDPVPQVQSPVVRNSDTAPEIPAGYEPVVPLAVDGQESAFSVLGSPQTDVVPPAPRLARRRENDHEEQEKVSHRITDGDSLPLLADRYLGDSSRWVEIYEQNQELLESPDLLPIGLELEILIRAPEDVGVMSPQREAPAADVPEDPELEPVDLEQWLRKYGGRSAEG